jgi:hypothetical protein
MSSFSAVAGAVISALSIPIPTNPRTHALDALGRKALIWNSLLLDVLVHVIAGAMHRGEAATGKV